MTVPIAGSFTADSIMQSVEAFLTHLQSQATDDIRIHLLEIGNSTVTPVVSNLRIDPALVDGYLPFAHFFLPP